MKLIAQSYGVDEKQTLDRIRHEFDIEWEHPTE